MRLTDAQIKEAIQSMRASVRVKKKLQRDALAGDPHARFSVYALYRRQQR